MKKMNEAKKVIKKIDKSVISEATEVSVEYWKGKVTSDGRANITIFFRDASNRDGAWKIVSSVIRLIDKQLDTDSEGTRGIRVFCDQGKQISSNDAFTIVKELKKKGFDVIEFKI